MKISRSIIMSLYKCHQNSLLNLRHLIPLKKTRFINTSTINASELESIISDNLNQDTTQKLESKSKDNIFEHTCHFDNTKIKWEMGKIANLTDGSCIATMDETKVLVTVSCSKSPSITQEYNRLNVDYKEKFTAVKKIPRTYTRREGAPRDREILISRLIDRAVRPRFEKGFLHDTLIMASVLSSNGDQDPDIVAINATSAALLCSNVAWHGPIGALRIGRIGDKFICNPNIEETEKSNLNILCAGNQEGLVLLEIQGKEVSENLVMKGLRMAQERIVELNEAQKELWKKAGKEKREFITYELNPVAKKTIFPLAKSFAEKVYCEQQEPSDNNKQQRSEKRNYVRQKLLNFLDEKNLLAKNEMQKERINIKDIEDVIKIAEYEIYRKMAIKKGIRIDGRGTKQIRPINAEINVLPVVHGSSLFNRGETQSLCIITVGNDRDVQKIDNLLGEKEKNLIVHYSFPSYCTNDFTRSIGISRREIGHGNLIERSLMAVMPKMDQFPFPIRLTAETMASQGSSSMAAVCAGSLALKDAGIPIKALVAGISIGLFSNNEYNVHFEKFKLNTETKDYVLLTDILGAEDFFGDMDFKISGTINGLTACQLDIKVPYIPLDIIESALDKAKIARRRILNIMEESFLNQNKKDFPKFGNVEINKDLLGNIIGEDGNRIHRIEDETGCRLIICEDTHEISIYGPTEEQYNKAENTILDVQGTNIREGEVYKVKVVRVMDFGAFVELPSGFQTLLHISEVSHERIRALEDILSEGMELDVKCLGRDPRGNLKMSLKALIKK